MDERARFIRDWERDDLSFTELCEHYGISRTIGYKWAGRRFASLGKVVRSTHGIAIGVGELWLDHLRVAASGAAHVQTSRTLAAPRSAAAVLFARERTAP